MAFIAMGEKHLRRLKLKLEVISACVVVVMVGLSPLCKIHDRAMGIIAAVAKWKSNGIIGRGMEK